MGQKHTGSPKIHGGGHTGLMGKQAAPSRLGGGGPARGLTECGQPAASEIHSDGRLYGNQPQSD